MPVWRRLAFGVIKTISVLCGALVVLAAIYFGTSAYAFVAVCKDFLDASPATVGGLSGKMVGAPLVLVILLAWLTLKIWRAADRVRMPGQTQAANPKTSRSRQLASWALSSITYVLGFLTVSSIMLAFLGALIILFAVDPSFDHNPLKFDFPHELYFWLPVGEAFSCAVLTLICWKLKNRLTNKFNIEKPADAQSQSRTEGM